MIAENAADRRTLAWYVAWKNLIEGSNESTISISSVKKVGGATKLKEKHKDLGSRKNKGAS